MTDIANPPNVYISRFSSPNNTVKWSMYFDSFHISEDSFLVDSAETFLYGIKIEPTQSYFSLYGFHTQDGTVAIAKQINNGI